MEESGFISVDNLTKTYGFKKFLALDKVTVKIGQGEIFGLIGPNGAGKTTLMGCLLGLLKPNSGTISIAGKSVDDLSVKTMTGFFPERPHFDAWMVVDNFLRYHHMLAKQPQKTIKQDIEQVLATVGLEPYVSKKLVRTLSRGMLQRLGLAQLLIGKPTLCFLDEPTSGMDPSGMALVHDLLLRWKQEGVTVIINSHHLDQVEKVCDRVAFIQDGKIRSIESMQLMHQSKHILIVHWGQPFPTKDLLTKIAREYLIEYELNSESSARFFVSSKPEGTKLLGALLSAGIAVEEVMYERMALAELFAKEQKGRSAE